MVPVQPVTEDGAALFNAAGGLGLFLLGMGLMTEALRNLAGNRLRQALLRFTRSPWSGAAAGAIGTALVQSSTATTVATVGFVSAGLLSFQASLGIIFGANVGSTGLGWLVALLGIKLDLARLMLPLVLLGAGLRLLGRGRQALLGQALAGFALLFVGIAALQQALAGQGLLLDPSRFDAATPVGRLQLLLLGLLSTVITQSSGAGVAASLAALAAGVIGLPQACALVIGMDVGTTVTALMASLGASLSARRTAAAHVIFNLFTAAGAFLLLPVYLAALQRGWPALSGRDPEFALTAFHSGFNLLGVLLVLPFTAPFAALIRRLVRPAQGRWIDDLADTPPADPTAAISQARQALEPCLLELLRLLRDGLVDGNGRRHSSIQRLAVLQADLDRLELYLDQIHLAPAQRPGSDIPARELLLHLLHGLDHLQRLHERCEEEQDRLRTAATSASLGPERQKLLATLKELLAWIQQGRWPLASSVARECAQQLHRRVDPYRQEVLAAVAQGLLDVDAGTTRLEAIRWLRRVSQHLERVCHHLGAIELA
ncbi:MAG: Na/Pi symporter [Prochlorococcaceae cyanobacterium]